jgi:hypothetical protein
MKTAGELRGMRTGYYYLDVYLSTKAASIFRAEEDSMLRESRYVLDLWRQKTARWP